MSPYKVEPNTGWTPQEKWAWQWICQGQAANFNEAEGYGGKLDPKKDENWIKDRILTQTFIKTILEQEPYCEALPPQGIKIIGAWFNEPLDLSDAIIKYSLKLVDSRIDKELIMYGAEIGGELGMDGSKFSAKVNMECLKVDSNCSMEGAEFDEEVTMRSAKIGGQLNMVGGSKFKGKVDMDKLEVGKSLFLSKDPQDPESKGAECYEKVILRSAKIGGQLVMDGSKFKGDVYMGGLTVNKGLYMCCKGTEFYGELILAGAEIGWGLEMDGSKFMSKVNMNKLKVDGSLHMREGAAFGGEIILISAKIKSQLSMINSNFEGKITMDSLEVDESLFMKGSYFLKEVDIIYSNINRNLDLSGSCFNSLDLTGSTIRGELKLGTSLQNPTQWKKDAKLILHNTKVGVLRDLKNAVWPESEKLVLNGFEYESLTGDEFPTAKEGLKWLRLQPKKPFPLQPYEQLAKVFRKIGHESDAKEILIAKQDDMVRYGALSWKDKISKWAIGFFIGHGYRPGKVLFRFIIPLIIIGTIIFWWANYLGIMQPSKERVYLDEEFKKTQKLPSRYPKFDPFFYSVDVFVPFVDLHQENYWLPDVSRCENVVLLGKVCGNYIRYYLWFHIFWGWILSTFLVLALTGLVRKE